ncbi:MAG: NADH-quinone oxidoreductase subunit NuoE [FCB group bacterium]|nr:NADH-quinone oxidoreductase subunit NuoE [FCB group bacterium]
MKHNLDKLSAIFNRYPQNRESLIAVLQDIQKEYHYLPEEALQATAKTLDVPLSKVFSVATFYNAFSHYPRGEKIIRICVGTTCHIRGAHLVQEQLENRLNIKAGSTTKDLKYTLETVNCVGACSQAPVVIVNNKYYGHVKVSDAKKLLRSK